MNTPAALSAKQLDVLVPGRELVRQLDVDCVGGEFLAILGRNGAGKTLTLHTLAGLRDPDHGSVALDGSELGTLSRRRIAQSMALLPQDADDLFPATVYDTALIGRHPHIPALRLESQNDHAIVRRSLAEMGLDTLANRDVTTLSGGERRRLAIAQTLAQTPQIYLLDEPLNHLDPQHQLEVLDLLAARAASGASLVATLHDVNLAMRYADRCLLLFGDGRWELGPAEQALNTDTLSELYQVRMDSVSWNGTRQFFPAATG